MRMRHRVRVCGLGEGRAAERTPWLLAFSFEGSIPS